MVCRQGQRAVKDQGSRGWKSAAPTSKAPPLAKPSLEKIKSYRNSIVTLSQQVVSKKLSGAEINEFNTWMKSSQTNLNKINDTLSSRKIGNQKQQIEQTINNYAKELKEYQDDIKEQINKISKK